MARAKKTEISAPSSEAEVNKRISDAFAILDECSPLSTMMDKAQSNIDGYDSTGCYVLDALISGKLKGGGFPEGRLSVLAAPSSVGKSYIGVQTAALAQKKGKNVIIFDSEYAIDKSFCANLGLDLSKCKYFPVKSIEQCKNAIYKFLSFVIEQKLQGKFFILVDSLGAMISELDFKRADADNNAADMGTYAKSLRQLIVMLANMAGQSKTTVICTNHIYNNPSALLPQVEKNQRGGEAVKYYPSTVVQLSATKVKETDQNIKHGEELVGGSKDAVGISIKAIQIKSRICRPYITCNMYLSWKTGLSKYYGLLDLAIEFGILETRGSYLAKVGDEKTLGKSRSALEFDEEFLESIIPDIQKGIDDNWTYTRHNIEDEELGTCANFATVDEDE